MITVDALASALGVFVVLIAAGFAIQPLLRRRLVSDTPLRPEESGRERARLYRQVLELEFDYQTGKLSEADYHELVAQLLGRAGLLLRAERTELASIEEEVEREIAEARRLLTSGQRTVEREQEAVR